MSCSYYIWRSEYYCTKKEERVDEDHYRIYCRDYSYSDCPIYKSDSSSGGCYLTSACTAAMGLPDDCEELSILRRFRDEWLSKQPGGKETLKSITESHRVSSGLSRAWMRASRCFGASMMSWYVPACGRYIRKCLF